MTHDELIAKMDYEVKAAEFESACGDGNDPRVARALRAVVELHKPIKDEWIEYTTCKACRIDMDDHYSPKYPCSTIQAIEEKLQ